MDVSGVDSTPLDRNDDHHNVQRELTPVAAKWKNIGSALRLRPDDLDKIDKQHSGDPTACMTSTVTEWLKRNYNVKKFGEPTWRWLVEAVGDAAGGANTQLAREIAERYGVPQTSAFTVTQQTSSSTQGEEEAQISPSPASSTIHKHPSPPPPFLQPVASSLSHLSPQSESGTLLLNDTLAQMENIPQQGDVTGSRLYDDIQGHQGKQEFEKLVSTEDLRHLQKSNEEILTTLKELHKKIAQEKKKEKIKRLKEELRRKECELQSAQQNVQTLQEKLSRAQVELKKHEDVKRQNREEKQACSYKSERKKVSKRVDA